MLDGNGRTALEIAVRANNPATISLLIKAEKSLLEIGPQRGTLLHIGARHRLAEVCVELISHGANVNRANAYGETPLEVAGRRSDDTIALILLDAGARITDAKSLLSMSGLKTDTCIDIFDRGFVRCHPSDEVVSVCHAAIVLILDNLCNECAHHEMLDRPVPGVPVMLSLLKHILDTVPHILVHDSFDLALHTGFRMFIKHWRPLRENALDIAADCLKVFIQYGFKPCSSGLWDTEIFAFSVDVAYTYAKACVETCDSAIYGRDLLDLLASLLDYPWLLAGEQTRLFELLDHLIDHRLDPGNSK